MKALFRRIKNRTWLAIGIVCSMGVLLIFLFTRLESHKRIEFGELAKNNRFLVSQLFLENYGVGVEFVHEFPDLPNVPHSSTLFFVYESSAPVSTELSKIFEWVRGGGEAIFLLDQWSNPAYRDEFLARAGIQQKEDPQAEEVTRNFTRYGNNIRPSNCQRRAGSISTPLDESGSSYEVNTYDKPLFFKQDISSERLLDFKMSELVTGTPFLGSPFGFGDGNIYVINSLRQWENDQIACFDNAHFLRMIATRWRGNVEGEGARFIWLEFYKGGTSLLGWVWINYRNLVVALLAMLALWLWYRMWRDSPPIAQTSESKSTFTDYLTSKSSFRWQNRTADSLLGSLRNEVSRGENQNDLDERMQSFAKVLGLPVQRISWALRTKQIRRPKELVEIVQILQKIRELQ